MTDATKEPHLDPDAAAAFSRHARYISPAFVKVLNILGYGRYYVRAQGTRLWDSAGNEYLDMLAGCGSINLGYNHPELVAAAEAALRSQAPSFAQVAPIREAGLLAETLAHRLGPELSVAFFCNSGAEAVEGSLKLAFAATRRTGVVYCRGAYHGLTLGALSAMGAERLRAPFPTVPGFEMVPFGDLEAAERLLRTRRFASFLVEPIQFEAGVHLAPKSYFAELSALCKRYGTALVFDEVQTGVGRTGTLFALEWIGVTPDIVCYAKGLSGGLVPIGGYSTSPDWHRRAYGRVEDCDLHMTTFGGGALACAVARRTLELVDEARLAHVREMGEHLEARLGEVARGSRMVREVRGRGLMWGLELGRPPGGVADLLTLGLPSVIARRLFAHWVALRMLERGYLTETPSHDENVLRIEPALIVEREEIDRFTDALAETLEENDSFARFVRDAGGRLIQRQLRPVLPPP